jgi:hypothetical protein
MPEDEEWERVRLQMAEEQDEGEPQALQTREFVQEQATDHVQKILQREQLVINDFESQAKTFESKLNENDASARAVSNSFHRLREAIPGNARGMIESMEDVARKFGDVMKELSGVQSAISALAIGIRQEGKLTNDTLNRLPGLTRKFEEARRKLEAFAGEAEQYAGRLSKWADGAFGERLISQDAFDSIGNACRGMKLGCGGMKENIGFMEKDWEKTADSITLLVRDKTQLEMEKKTAQESV